MLLLGRQAGVQDRDLGALLVSSTREGGSCITRVREHARLNAYLFPIGKQAAK